MPTISALKRTFYYAEELLRESDFNGEQAYFRERIRRQSKAAWTAGVVGDGLHLTLPKGSVFVVTEGMALDADGASIFLLHDAKIDLAKEVRGKNAATAFPAGTYVVSIAYVDDAADKDSLSVRRSSHQITEQSVIAIAPSAPTTEHVVLGTITVGADGVITDVSEDASSGRLVATSRCSLPSAPTTGSVTSATALSVGADPSPATDTSLRVTTDFTARASALSVARFVAKTSAHAITIDVGASTPAGVDVLSVQRDGAVVWRLDEMGTPHSVSDLATKEDVVPLDGALAKALALRGVSFRWKTPRSDGRRAVGLVAQEVEAVLPEAVDTSAQGVKTLAYDHVVALLVEALRELTERVAVLESKGGGGATR